MTQIDAARPGLSIARLRNWMASQTARSWLLILITSLYPLAVGSLQDPPTGYELPLATWLWDSLLGAGLGLTMVLANLIRVPVRLKTNLAVWVISALVGALLPVVISVLVAEPEEHVLTDWPLAWIGHLGLLLFGLILISAIKEYRQSSTELNEKIWRLENRSDWLKQQIQEHGESVSKELISELNPQLEEIGKLVASKKLLEASENLKSLLEIVLRPFSEELTKTSFRVMPAISKSRPRGLSLRRFGRALARRVSLGAIFPSAVALLFGLIFLSHPSTLVNGTDGLLFTISYLLAVMLASWIFARFVQKIKLPYLALFALNVLLGVSIGSAYLSSGVAIGLSNEFGLLGFVAFGITLIYWLTGFTSLYLATKYEANREAAALAAQLSLAVAELNVRTLALRRRLAFKMHGGLQALLQTILVRISRIETIRDEDIQDLSAQLAKAQDLLDADQLFEATDQSDFSLLTLKQQWSEVCEVQIEVSADADVALRNHHGLAELVFEICRERVLNAVKHSGAESISILVKKLGNQLLLETTNEDFSLVFNDSRKNGLGSQLLDQSCTEWQLNLVGSKAVFSAKIAVPTVEG